ncbi:MAG TPA: VWA domain-containing protein [Gammaproteobacteria bacterium]
MAELHFLRPWWLLALPVGAVLLWWLLRGRSAGSSWRSVVDPALQRHVLAEPEVLAERRWLAVVAAAALTVATLALAGPAWERLPVPAFRSNEALVVALDLSRSMDAGDVEPSRVERAKLKLLSLLERRAGGQTALVVFSDHAFTVTPLTTDVRTIASLVNVLGTDIMPSSGSAIRAGLAKAAALLQQGGARRGEILLMTDAGVSDEDRELARSIAGEGHVVHVLAVGTEQGAPIPTRGGGFVTDEAGNVVVPQVNHAALRRLAADGGGNFAALAPDDRDLDALFPERTLELADIAEAAEEEGAQADVWRDAGVWLTLALLPLVALGFRRGWIAGLVAAVVLVPADGAHAFEWSALWKRGDQRGYELLQAGEAERAADVFEDPVWRSAAEYRAGLYAQSAATLQGLDDAEAHYNRGTALAKAGELEAALAALDRALELDPNHEDARYNRDVIREFLEQNPPPQEQQGSSDPSQGGGEQQQASAEQGEQGEAPQGEQGQGGGEQSAGAEQSTAQEGDQTPPGGDASSDLGDGGQDDFGKQGEREGAAEVAEAEGDVEEGAEPLAMDVEQWASEQAAEQWLRRVPQDPGGLLRRKFLYQYQRLGVDQDGNTVWPGGEGDPW